MATVKNRFTFPKTTLNYINIITPDGKFDPTNPKYQVTMKYTSPEAKAIVADFNKLFPSLAGKLKAKFDEDGNATFKASQKQFIKWSKAGMDYCTEVSPVCLAVAGLEVPTKNPWGGSTGEVAVEFSEGEKMATRLMGIRFHSLEYGDSSSSDEPMDELFAVTNVDRSEARPVAPVEVYEIDEDDLEKAFAS